MIFKIILLLVVLTALGYSIYLLYEEIPNIHEVNILKGYIQEDTPEELLNTKTLQFYPNMRFNHLPITYYMEPECSKEREQNMELATSMLEQKTPLSFIQVSSTNADVKVECDEKRYKEEGEEGLFIAGHGGPSVIINATPWSVIKKGVITLFTESCNANIELHEMLHVLGFDHSPNPQSIMYNISSCDQKLTNDIIQELNQLYSQEPLPDIYLKNISAVKQGRYLNIKFGVFNHGLIDADNVEVTIYADGELVKTFPIDKGIEIGAGRYLSIENLRLPKLEVSEIKLVADPKNYIKEINENDNTAILKSV